MLLNKTVYLEGGAGTQLCSYDPDDLKLSVLWIIIFILSLALNAFAVIGNSIVVAACFLQKSRPSLLIYIHALAFSDLLYALVAPLYTYRYVLRHFPKLVINFALAGRLSHHVTIIGNTFSSISSWLVVALTIDRLILTKLPFRSKQLSTAKRTYIAIAFIIFSCSIINGVWMYEFFEVPIDVNPCSGYWNIPKEVIRDDGSVYVPIRYKEAYKIYAITSAVLFLYALPTFIMIVSNVLILKELKSSTLKTRSMETSRASQKRHKEVRLTKMIIIVSVIFMICNMPDIATRLLWKHVAPIIVSNIQPIAHLFLMVNVAANFVVYSLYNKHLFATIVSMIRRGACYSCCMGSSDATDTTLQESNTTSKNTNSQDDSRPFTTQA